MGGGFNGSARSLMSPGLLRQIAEQEEAEARKVAEELRKREERAEEWRSRATAAAIQDAVAAGEQFTPRMLAGRGLGHTKQEFIALVSARQDHEDAQAAARAQAKFRSWQLEQTASVSINTSAPTSAEVAEREQMQARAAAYRAKRVEVRDDPGGPPVRGVGSGRTVTAGREQVAAAAAAQQLGEATAATYWQAAAATPGAGALVAMVADVGTVGEGYNLPAGTPAIRPAVRPVAQPQYADLSVGGIGPGGYHGTDPGQASGALEGVSVARGDSLVYIPVSPPAASRPSLGSRVRSALRALWRR